MAAALAFCFETTSSTSRETSTVGVGRAALRLPDALATRRETRLRRVRRNPAGSRTPSTGGSFVSVLMRNSMSSAGPPSRWMICRVRPSTRAQSFEPDQSLRLIPNAAHAASRIRHVASCHSAVVDWLVRRSRRACRSSSPYSGSTAWNRFVFPGRLTLMSHPCSTNALNARRTVRGSTLIARARVSTAGQHSPDSFMYEFKVRATWSTEAMHQSSSTSTRASIHRNRNSSVLKCCWYAAGANLGLWLLFVMYQNVLPTSPLSRRWLNDGFSMVIHGYSSMYRDLPRWLDSPRGAGLGVRPG